MAEIINSIKEVFDIKFNKHNYIKFDGYQIFTSEHEYQLLIDNGQCCCEDWGYFASNDDEQRFVGKELVNVEVTDVGLNTKNVNEYTKYGFDQGGIQFVNFKMADGDVFQIAVYNGHNGYYGHDILFVKDGEFIIEECL